MYRIIIILSIILSVSVSASAQEMIMYGKVEQIEKRSIMVDGKKFPIQKGSLVRKVKIGERVKIVESPEGVVRVERIRQGESIEILE